IDGVGVSRRTDIFALGLVYYELLTGQAAIQARSSAEGITNAALNNAQNFLIQMVNSSAPSAVDSNRDKALKAFRRIPQIPEMLEAMTMRQKTDRIGSKDLSDDLDLLLEDLLAPPRPFPKAFLIGACLLFLLPFVIWHVMFRLFPPEPKVKIPPQKSSGKETTLSASEQQYALIKDALKGDQQAMGKITGLSLTQCKDLGKSSFKRLNLASLKTLLPEEAAALARFRGEELVLTGLKSLDFESAKELAYFFGEKLALSTEKPMGEGAMRELLRFSGDILDLSRQQEFLPDAIPTAGRFSGTLLIAPKFQDQTELSRTTERSRVQPAERLIIKRLEAGSLKELQPLKTLSVVIARAILKNPKFHDKRLLFVNLSTLTPQCAGILARFKGRELRMTNLTTLSVQSARALSRFHGSAVTIRTLEDLEPEVMAEFIPFAGDFLTFDTTTTLTVEQAKVISQFKTKLLKLYLLRIVEDGSLAQLAKFNGASLKFTPAMVLTAPQIGALAQFRGKDLQISVYDVLTEPKVKSLLRFKGRRLNLTGVGSMTPKVAGILSQWSGDSLSFTNLNSLADEAAKKLIKFKGSTLGFTNVPMATSTKKILGSFPGTIKIEGN
ncbi:MAG: hypothetical protein P1V97_06910, partial [Planctomycetota bacterium]|nr:hypothetical protein [Planctomycetota bacterium]